MCSCKIATAIFFELPADDISHLYFLLTAIVSRKLEVTKHQEIYTHFLNSNFVFSKIFFSFEDLSMATQAKKMKYRTKYSDELKKQFSFVSKCFSSTSDTSFFATFVTWTSLVLLVVLTMLKNRLIHQTTKEMNSPLNGSILT